MPRVATLEPKGRIPVRLLRSTTRCTRMLSFVLAVMVLFVSGCVTGQVRELVEDSNTAIVSTILTRGTPDADPSGKAVPAAGTDAAIEDIEQFIAQNPDQRRIIAALRVRQAILLLNAGRRNAAQAAFAAIASAEDLASQRDLTLYRISDRLIWWYGAAPRPAWNAADIAEAARTLDVLASEGDSIPNQKDGRHPSIRFFVEQMRVRVALKAARASADADFVKQRVREDVVRYASVFDAIDQDQIQKLCLNQPVGNLRFEMLRW